MIHSCALTDRGKVRKNNEDSWISDQQRGIFLVADGVGGNAGGEIASSLAASMAYQILARQDVITPAERLRGAFHAANRAVMQRAKTQHGLEGMASTLVALLLTQGEAWIAHTGDSRCYLLRKQMLMLLTPDHSFPNGSLMHAIGAEQPVYVTTKVMSTHPNDVFLLCSDGLTNAIQESQIAYHLKKRRPVEALCRDLVQAALDAGGPDNVTVIVARSA